MTLALGYQSVAEMLRNTTSEELTAWQLYEQMEPFGERAAYQRHAQLMAMLVNLTPRKNATAVKPEDFMPETFKTPPEPADPRAALLALAHAVGGKRLKVRSHGESR